MSDSEHNLDQYVQQQPEWAERKFILTSTPVVGVTLAYALLPDMPELRSLTNKQAASLVGGAPINRDSSRLRG